jgi:hypothetical protein
MVDKLTPEQERALTEALQPLFDLMRSYPRDRNIGYEGPVEAVTLFPVLIGQKPNGDAVIADPAALLDGTPSLCWREWARVDADEVMAQSSAGPKRGGVKLLDLFRQLSSGGGSGALPILLELFTRRGAQR